MKKIILLPCLFLILFSCNELKPKVPEIIISGEILNFKDSTIKIFQENYEHSIKINAGGKFTDTIYDFEEGYFRLKAANQYTYMYLKDGYDVSLFIDYEQFDESLKYDGIGAHENNFLAKKTLYDQGVNYWSFCKENETIFIQKIDSFVAAKNYMLEEYKTVIPEFDTSFYYYEKQNNKYLGAYVKEQYQNAHKYYTKKDSFQVSENFYSYRKNIPLENERLLVTSYYPMYVKSFIKNHVVENDTSERAFELLRMINRHIQDNPLKKEFIYQSAKENMNQVKELDDYWALVSYMVTDKSKYSELKKMYRNLKKILPGNYSPMTTFKNINDETRKLEQFEGKYVYIDCWAEWCGPCKREIPHYKELEKKYENADIHFLKLSLDSDVDAWKKYITENELTHNSFILEDNYESKFAKAYFINGIPRFILLDKELKIIDADAKRPSNEALISELDSLLSL